MPKFNVYIEREDKKLEVTLASSRPTIKELLERLKLNSVAVLAIVNNEVCTEEETISPKDNIKIVSVVSGG